MKILIVLTSHDKLGDTGKKTGFWLEEFAAPYYHFLDAGADITLASPAGGQPPLDPVSNDESAQTEATKRFAQDEGTQKNLARTQKLSQIKTTDFDAVFYPGGHGPLWDLTNDENSIKLIEDFYDQNKIVSAVCHAPAVLLKVKDKDGNSLIKGKKVTGFTDSEEEAVGLLEVVPFSLEQELKACGGLYEKKADWQSFCVQDGNLITGQNPQSSVAVADAVLKSLKA